jgi:hypothetical protein
MAEERWFWWAGLDGDVECENNYCFGEFGTRNEAIEAGRAAMPDVDGNTFFHIIEATFGVQVREGDDFQPFGATRNHEIIEHVAA